MDAELPKAKTQATPAEAPKLTQLREAPKPARPPTRIPAIIVGVVVAAIAGLSIWYLVRPRAAAGAGRGRRDAARHRRAGRRARRRHPGRARPERRRRRRAGADRQSRDDRQARAGAGRQGRRRGAARQHQCRHARGGDRRAQGRAGAGAGERGAGAEDLRPHQPAGRARQRAAGAARPGDRFPAREPARASIRPNPPTSRRSTATPREEREIAEANVGKAVADIAGRAIDHRSDGGLRAGGLAGLPAQRGARRIRFARRAAGDA